MDEFRTTMDIYSPAKNLHEESSPLHLVGYEGWTLVWAFGKRSNSYCRTLQPTIKQIERGTWWEKANYWARKPKSYAALWQRSTSCCSRDSANHFKLGLGSSPARGICTRLGPIRLSPVPVNATRFEGEPLPNSGRCMKIRRWLYRLKICKFLFAYLYIL